MTHKHEHWTAGVDAGSRTIKAVVWDARARRVAGAAEGDQGMDQAARADRLLDGALAQAGVGRDRLAGVVATGYGRAHIRHARAVTEITCHARGVAHAVPGARTILDIGGQDSKVIWLDERGAVTDFMMNDRCAAGTGRYLEMVAERLHIPVSHIGLLAAEAIKPAAISSTCAVFAETELTGLLAAGAGAADLAAGVLRSIFQRLAAMTGGRARAPIVFTGGVARIPGLQGWAAQVLDADVQLAPDPLYTGALGAALLSASSSH